MFGVCLRSSVVYILTRKMHEYAHEAEKNTVLVLRSFFLVSATETDDSPRREFQFFFFLD